MPAMIDDAAARDAEVDFDRGAELERGFQDAQVLGRDRDAEEAAAREERHREPERVLARAEVELRLDRLVDERHLEVRAEADVRQREHADREVGDREVEARP